MSNEGFFTLPGEIGLEDYTLQLAKKWKADCIRDSDGTALSEKILTSGYGIYSTICIIREHNEFAKSHPETLAQTFLSTPFITAFSTSFTICLMDYFYAKQFKVNESAEAFSYMEVWDRSEERKLDKSEYSYKDGCVFIEAKQYHSYSVSFLAYRIWEEISMYNSVTNDWNDKEPLLPVDPRRSEAREYLLKYLKEWCESHKNTTVVRFTSLFYNFVWIWGKNAENLFTDWASYDFTVSVEALKDFEKEYGYALTAEDFINKGSLQVTHMPPSKHKKDYMDFTMRYVTSLAKEMVDIVRSYGKKAFVFYDDSWVGMEPWGKYFDSIGFDGLIKCVFSGFEVRLCSGAPAPIHELRLHPYLFPVGLGGAPTFSEGGHPDRDAKKYWMNIRRALLHAKIDRIGVGGYLHLVKEYPVFETAIEEICNEFEAIKNITSKDESEKVLGRVAVLHTWGHLRSWTLSGHFHETYMHPLIHINEALSGLPVEVEYIDFEEAKGDLSRFDLIINAGRMGDAWSGGDVWKDSNLVASLRRYVAEGGAFLGVKEPTAINDGAYNLALFDVLSLGLDKGQRVNHYKAKPKKENWTSLSFKENSDIYAITGEVKQLNSEDYIGLTENLYGKGKGFYMSDFSFSTDSAFLLTSLILKAQNRKREDCLYLSDNSDVEVSYYKKEGVLVVINNNLDKKATAKIRLEEGVKEITLLEGELKVLKGVK